MHGRRFDSDDHGKRRRQLGPVSWANAFKALMEARGVKKGRGTSNQHTRASVTVTEAAREAGVSPKTAERRVKLAEELEPYPETAQKVDRGEVKVKDAMKEAAREAQRDLHSSHGYLGAVRRSCRWSYRQRDLHSSHGYGTFALPSRLP